MQPDQPVTTAVILAGGLGTRLREVVPDFPKPMAPISGRPFLEYQLDYWIKQGIKHFVLSVGYRHEMIQAHFGHQYGGAVIEYAIENTPLGTGGGLFLALPKLSSEAFLLLNGDTFFEVNLKDLKAFHQAHQSDWSCALYPRSDADRYMGVALNEDNQIIELKSTAKTAPVLVNGGVYLIEPAVLALSGFKAGDKFSLEEDLLPRLKAKGAALYGHINSGRFIDIGVPQDYYQAANILTKECFS